MDGEHNQYATLSRRQVALFERNPVCGLCYRICMDMCEEYGGINFELLDSIVLADNLCEQILQDPWNLNGVEYYSGWVRNRLGNSQPAIVCTFATTCVTLSCIEGLPEPVYQLAHDLRGLIIGEGNELYYNLSSAAYRQDIILTADSYGVPPPKPDALIQIEQLEQANAQLTYEVSTLKTQLKMKDQQSTGGTTINCKTYIAELNNDIHDNHNCQIYAVPADERLTNERMNELTSERVSELGNERVKKLFCNAYGDEDIQRTEEEKQRVKRYIADHNLGNRQLDSARDNPLNRMAVCFCAKWQSLRHIGQPVSATALLRFLSDDCGIELATEPKPIANVLAKMLKADKDKDTFYDVCEYF